MIYVTLSGQRYEADGPDDLVNQLRESSWEASSDAADFIQKSAGRAGIQSGHVVRSDTAQHYVDDLIANGLLKIEPEK